MLPISHASVPDLVLAELSRAIVSGRYAPGERLPSQRTLAAEFEVNMASVREALSRLEQLRLVEVRQGEPMRVLDWRRSGGLEALAVLGAFDEQVIASLFEARRLLLEQSAGLAAQRRSGEEAEELIRLAAGIASAGDDATALLADWEFMSAIVQAAGNLVFALIMNSVRELYLPNMVAFRAIVGDRERTAPLYRAIADAIAARDRDGAAAALAQLAGAQEELVRRAAARGA